jgi:hypothetical protein
MVMDAAGSFETSVQYDTRFYSHEDHNLNINGYVSQIISPFGVLMRFFVVTV